MAGIAQKRGDAEEMKGGVLLRCDAGARVGMGHYRRCRAMATALREEGVEVRWRIGVEAGVSFPEGMDGVELIEAGAEAWEEFVQVAGGFSLVVIDHYELAAAADEKAGFAWMRFDAGVRREPTSAVLIHNALPGTREADYAGRLRNPEARVLSGPGFALLDGSFAEEREMQPDRSGQTGRILLTFGGGDDRGATVAALDELDRCLPEGTRVVATSSANRSLEALKERAARDPRIELRIDETRMAGLMAGVDAAVTAGGTTLNELACLGVPGWVVAIAENQERPARMWADAGAMRYGGTFESGKSFEGLGDFLRNEAGLRVMGGRGRELVDGQGAVRTAREIRRFLSDWQEGRNVV